MWKKPCIPLPPASVNTIEIKEYLPVSCNDHHVLIVAKVLAVPEGISYTPMLLHNNNQYHHYTLQDKVFLDDDSNGAPENEFVSILDLLIHKTFQLFPLRDHKNAFIKALKKGLEVLEIESDGL